MMLRIPVEPNVLRWARERARLTTEALAKRFPTYVAWEAGDLAPTYKQLQNFAKFTHVPFGALLLSKPLHEPFPLPDFRTIAGTPIVRPSPDLLDTVYHCERRQDWYHNYALFEELEPVPLVRSEALGCNVENAAARLRRMLRIELEDRAQLQNWETALRQLIRNTEEVGILVMVSGIVGSNTHRKLDPLEFRGFALADPLAPLVFVNGADSKAAQMFTLAHEIAHIALGKSALSDLEPTTTPSHEIESWCNRVAAELLVPLEILELQYRPGGQLASECKRLARYFKVSTLVILRRIYDLGVLQYTEFTSAYKKECKRVRPIRGKNRATGGDFYATQTLRVSKRFALALISNTLEGKTLYRDAFRLLGLRKSSTFRNLADRLGVK